MSSCHVVQALGAGGWQVEQTARVDIPRGVDKVVKACPRLTQTHTQTLITQRRCLSVHVVMELENDVRPLCMGRTCNQTSNQHAPMSSAGIEK